MIRHVLSVSAFSVAVLACAAAAPADPVTNPSIHTIAGTGVPKPSVDAQPATRAGLRLPRAISLHPNGGYLIAEPYRNRIRRVLGDGTMVAAVGTGTQGYNGDDCAAAKARVNFPHGVAALPGGSFLVADTQNNRIRRVSPDGRITTVAGNGYEGAAGDGGQATLARINNPRSVTPLRGGGFFISDTDNHRVRRVSATGIIETVAGIGSPGWSGDGGPATAARLNHPFAVAVARDGSFLIADVSNQRIRRVSVTGQITTVAGNGEEGFSGDGGPAVAASLSDPHGIALMRDGGFLIADSSNNRVRRVLPDGTIVTIAGTGVRAGTGDRGPAIGATLAAPKSVSVDAAGNVLVADESNHRIRLIGTIVKPRKVTQPGISGTITSGRLVRVRPGRWSGTWPVAAYRWLSCDRRGGNCRTIRGATGRTYRIRIIDIGKSLRVRAVARNPSGSATAMSRASTIVVRGSAGAVTPQDRSRRCGAVAPTLRQLRAPALLKTSDADTLALKARLTISEAARVRVSVFPRGRSKPLRLLSGSLVADSTTRANATQAAGTVRRAGTVVVRVLLARTSIAGGRTYLLRVTATDARALRTVLIVPVRTGRRVQSG